MKIRDIARRNTNARFENDVQIGSFRSVLNLELVRSFIFTTRSWGDKRSSVDILKSVVDSFLPGGAEENRFVVIATYGHGKSHFGLAMANYFGMPCGSPELDAVLTNIQHASADEAAAQGLRAFRNNRAKPFLIVTVRGDETGTLRQRVLKAVEVALSGNERTKDVNPPSWFVEAERIMSDVVLPRATDANELLGEADMDVTVVRDRLMERDDTMYPLFRDLVRHLTGVQPDLHAQTNLQELINWLCTNHCGQDDDKPFSGVLVLFDEFSTFVEEYAAQNKEGTPLQELLNGISDQRQLAAFVALAQHDPDTVAINTLRFDSGHTRLDNVKHELSRLPASCRFKMYSSLEDVLDAYLRQDEQRWKRLITDRAFQRAITEGSTLAYDVFSDRYARMSWSPEQFNLRVTKGCFPLHPLTTAIISAIELDASSNPRSILGFVFDALDKHANVDAVSDGVVNWILPVALVDYFREMLGPDFRRYESTRKAIGPDQSPENLLTLKAMLLQSASEIPTAQAGGYARVIAAMAGLTVGVAKEILRRMNLAGYIRFDSHLGSYSFWDEGQGAYRVEKRLAELVDGHQFTSVSMSDINEMLSKDGILRSVEPRSLSWGHPADWAAEEWLLTSSELSSKRLKSLMDKDSDVLQDRRRAVIAYVVASDEQAVESLKADVSSALDDTLGPRLDAMIVFRPTQPAPEALQSLYKYWLLREKFTNRDRLDVGQSLYESEVDRYKGIAEEVVRSIRANAVAVVPEPFRERVDSLGKSDTAEIIADLEGMVYKHNPKSFVTNQKLSSTRLRSEVWFLAALLAKGALRTNRQALQQHPMADDIVRRHLTVWGVVDGDLELKEPEHGSAELAWSFLEEEFPPAKNYVSVDGPLKRLMSRPFGFDTNTMTLLLCAWLGFRRADLSLAHEHGNLDEIISRSGRPREFLSEIGSAKIRRLDPNALREELGDLEDEIGRGDVSVDRGQEIVGRLDAFQADVRFSAEDNQRIEELLSKLRADVSRAREYNTAARSMLVACDDGSAMEIIAKLRVLKDLPVIGSVQPDEPLPASIRQRLTSALEERILLLEGDAREARSLADCQEQELRLQTIMDELKLAGMDALVSQVQGGLDVLKARKREMKAREADDYIAHALESAPLSQSLADLRSGELYFNDLKEKAQSDEVRSRVEQHLQRIRARVVDLESFASRLLESVEKAVTIEALRKCQRELNQRLAHFEGTPEGERLSPLGDKLAALEDSLRTLGNLSTVQLESPAQAKDVLRELASLRDQMPYEAQAEILSKETAAVEARIQGAVQLAAEWYKSAKSHFDKQEFTRDLLTSLALPPAFLPEEYVGEVAAMCSRVREELESDEVELVVAAFQRIVSAEKRRQCYDRLSGLLD